MTRINSSTIEIRQAYQTKMFITDKIFKSLNQQISFMGLLMVNRFENFKYFRQLKYVLEDQKSLSRVNFLTYLESLILRTLHKSHQIEQNQCAE